MHLGGVGDLQGRVVSLDCSIVPYFSLCTLCMPSCVAIPPAKPSPHPSYPLSRSSVVFNPTNGQTQQLLGANGIHNGKSAFCGGERPSVLQSKLPISNQMPGMMC